MAITTYRGEVKVANTTSISSPFGPVTVTMSDTEVRLSKVKLGSVEVAGIEHRSLALTKEVHCSSKIVVPPGSFLHTWATRPYVA